MKGTVIGLVLYIGGRKRSETDRTSEEEMVAVGDDVEEDVCLETMHRFGTSGGVEN